MGSNESACGRPTGSAPSIASRIWRRFLTVSVRATVIVLTADQDVTLLGRALLEGAVAGLSNEIPFVEIVFAIHQAWRGEPAMGRTARRC